ncbi:MAG: ferritin family protein [Syntrophomonadaceae bacterium]|jgi:rubrerythrin|nr:ferritin family protein [Bacillota bacterium]HQA50880.1 ferritin family protein [Syntrophomonadaceae bacterium]
MSQLSIEAILNKAIEREVEAYEFYLALSQKNLDAYVKEIFAELAAEEKGHQTLLQSFLNNPDKPLRFKPSADFKVAQTVDGPTLSLDMKPVDAIALAMKREEEAMNYYTALAESSETAEQAKAFQELATMEQGHKTRLEELYTNMAFPEVW